MEFVPGCSGMSFAAKLPSAAIVAETPPTVTDELGGAWTVPETATTSLATETPGSGEVIVRGGAYPTATVTGEDVTVLVLSVTATVKL